MSLAICSYCGRDSMAAEEVRKYKPYPRDSLQFRLGKGHGLFPQFRWGCAALLFLAFARSVVAFEGYEHKHLGDLALRIAVDYAEVAKLKNSEKDFYWASLFDERCDKLHSAVQSFYRTRSGSVCPHIESMAPSYGDLVKLVDYMNYPHQLLESPAAQMTTGIPKDFKQLNQRLIEDGHKNLTFGMARAATNNEYHFQAGLFNLLIRLHSEAIDLSSRNELFAALVTNALADHFLHDFFAPGHITTSRENSHDAVALGMHDTVNRLGAQFEISQNQAKWKDGLEPILDFIRDNHRIIRGNYDLSLGNTRYTEDEIASAIASLEKDHKRLKVVGDDLLQTNARQQLFILLVEIRALLDILNADYQTNGDLSPGRNSLDEYVWTEYDDYRPDIKPRAGIPYGEYDIDVRLLSRASNILIVAIGGEAPISELSSSRLLLNAEIVPLALIGESEFLRAHTINKPTQQCHVFSFCNIGPAIGITFINDTRFSALGPSLRIIKAFPKIDTQVSIYYQLLKYDFQMSERKSSYGVRFDTGFSLYTAFIALGKGYFVDSEQQLHSDTVVSFGIALGFPLSRLPVHW
ncbi:MAG: hypothetical protein HY067_21005 [Betaproteobacteria bacterium]|nr:hypothetical protein [Betaproteobacteria bacterium]